MCQKYLCRVLFVRAWEDEAAMSEPCSKAAVDHEGNEDDRVNPERHGEEAGGEEDGVLDGVEARAGEGGRVVALVVELVDVLVEESTLKLEIGWILWNEIDALGPDQVLVAS